MEQLVLSRKSYLGGTFTFLWWGEVIYLVRALEVSWLIVNRIIWRCDLDLVLTLIDISLIINLAIIIGIERISHHFLHLLGSLR